MIAELGTLVVFSCCSMHEAPGQSAVVLTEPFHVVADLGQGMMASKHRSLCLAM
jgi:hypothetical protein